MTRFSFPGQDRLSKWPRKKSGDKGGWVARFTCYKGARPAAMISVRARDLIVARGVVLAFRDAALLGHDP
jgi:hypothetical protein